MGGPHLADAVADPGAVVVELADAVVADGAVRAARRAVVVAGVAPLGAHREAVHVELLRLHAPARTGAPSALGTAASCTLSAADRIWQQAEHRD